MALLVSIFTDLLYFLMRFCNSFALTILFFVILTKIVFFPITLIVQKNSVRMLRVAPEINELKAKFYYDPERFFAEQRKIYKREKYSPLLSAVPMILQLLILLGMIAAIKECASGGQISMMAGAIDLRIVPSGRKGWYILAPLMAAATSYYYSDVQNKYNVLQAQQSGANHYIMLILSVLLSLYLGWFVPLAVAWYWSINNIISGLQTHLVNLIISPKVVDTEALKKSVSKLETIKKEDRRRRHLDHDQKMRQKEDYKRFFSVANKHLVFYSEGTGFYKYYRAIIQYILKESKLTIHYITGDYQDDVFEIFKDEPRVRVYFIGELKLIELMMRMDADVVIMTMPDLENMHIKRSCVKNDVTYIYLPHGMDSHNMTLRKGALDHYDAVLCTGKHLCDEIAAAEELYRTKKKVLVESGYPLLDELIEKYKEEERTAIVSERKKILIAPSWQEDNILDSCLEEICEGFAKIGSYDVTIRPHPYYIRHNQGRIAEIEEYCGKHKNISLEKDISSDRTVYGADILITDWSSISYEYAFSTNKPVIFINTPMKVVNPEYKALNVEPINVWLRKEIGAELDLKDASSAAAEAVRLIAEKDLYRQKIERIVHENTFHVGDSAAVIGDYIINEIKRHIENKKTRE